MSGVFSVRLRETLPRAGSLFYVDKHAKPFPAPLDLLNKLFRPQKLLMFDLMKILSAP